MIEVNAAINRQSVHNGSQYDVENLRVNWGGVSESLITDSVWSSDGGEVTGIPYAASTPPDPENVHTEATATFTRAENVFKNAVTFADGSVRNVTITVRANAA